MTNRLHTNNVIPLPYEIEDIWRWNDIAGVEKDLNKVALYRKLITEEYNEFVDGFIDSAISGFTNKDAEVEELDACVDMIWVIVGYMRSRGWSKETVTAAIEEVRRSNYSKFVTKPDGTVECVKRADGKILKPDTFSPADIHTLLV